MPVSDYTPTVDDVAAAMTARLNRRWGGSADTFNEETRPTAAQVQSLIDKAVGLVAVRIGSDLPNPELIAAATDVVVLRVSLRIEAQYFPEQLKNGSAWDEIKKMYDEDFKTLIDAVADARASEPGDPGDTMLGPGGMPTDSFDQQLGLVGPRTVW